MIPTISDITKPLLKLIASEGEIHVTYAESKLGKEFKLTKDELAQEKSSGGERLFLHRIRWAVTYLKKAKLIKAIGRGQVAILKQGQKLIEDPECPEKITESYLNRYKSFKETRRSSA